MNNRKPIKAMIVFTIVAAFSAICGAISSYGDIPIEDATDVAAVMSLGVVYIIVGLFAVGLIARLMDGLFSIIATTLEWWDE